MDISQIEGMEVVFFLGLAIIFDTWSTLRKTKLAYAKYLKSRVLDSNLSWRNAYNGYPN